jgi:hypothetical protein
LVNGNCTPDAYFAARDCFAGVTANIDIGPYTASTKVWATVDGAGNYPLSPDSQSGNGVHTWMSANVIPITGPGPHVVSLRFALNGNGNGTALGDVQRAYEAGPDSGPLFLVQAYEGATLTLPLPATIGPYSYQGGTTHTIGITVNTQGNLLLSDPGDPPIYLKVFNDNGNASQTQSINCDPALSNLQSEIESGCSPTYKTQTALTCPYANKTALWGSPQPWTCVAIQTGAQVGQITHGLNQRIYGSQNPPASACNTAGLGGVNWPYDQTTGDFASDKRVLPLFVTPLGTFQGNGSDIVPVLDFGYFYVTGYKGDPCEGVDTDQTPVPSNRGSYVRGHFIKFFPIDDRHTSDDNCDLTTITPCVGVLTR